MGKKKITINGVIKSRGSLVDSQIQKPRRGIVTKLIAAFMIPVAFVIIIGAVSYTTASKAIISNYKEASLQSMILTSKYINFGFDGVKAKAVQYITDRDMNFYLRGSKNNVEEFTTMSNIKNRMSTEQIIDEFLENIHIISAKKGVMTTARVNEKDIYGSFLASDGGKPLAEKPGTSYWLGSDSYLDKVFSIKPEAYAIRYVAGFSAYDSCVVFDISTLAINDILNNMNFGEGSIVGFVTNDGRETIPIYEGEEVGQIFTNQDFYTFLLEAKDQSISKAVTYKGDKYLFIGAKVGTHGSTVCALVPYANIVQKVKGIKNIAIILVAVSCIIAVLVGVMVASGMKQVIRHIINELEKVSRGDLTIIMKVKSKDEFNILSQGINKTIKNMRVLIEKVKLQSSSVKSSSDKVTKASDVFTKATQGISESINEIQAGVTQQASDAENCLLQMDMLSKKIQIVSGKTDEISKIAAETKGSVITGIASMTALNGKARKTSEITTRVITNIEVLEEKSKSISQIVETINEIAGQTNLLSLNASIEAARAGEAGRGFNVVAEEIRMLADQSMRSVKEIEILIKEIQLQTKNTVIIANEADSVVAEQEAAVNDTEKSLKDLSLNVEKLINNVDMITDSIANMDTARAGTLSAIENISAVSQQTAAATMTVNETTSEQMKAVSSLKDLSKELDENAQALEFVVQQFILE